MKKSFRKILLIMFVLITAMICFAFSASALSSSGQCGENVTYTYNSSTKKLVISGKGPMYDYESAFDSPFYNSDIKSVDIKDGVSSVGAYAFYECTRLTEITIGNNVTSIGRCAYSSCSNVKSVVIPVSVTSIDDVAFYYCKGITDVYYCGTEAQWNKISIGSRNNPLTNAKLHFNYKSSVAKPIPPATITATQTTSTITLKWSASAGATGYRVYQYSPSKGKYVQIASVKGVTSYKKSKNLKANTTYKFKIKPYVKLADGTVIWGDASKAFAFTTAK